MTTPLRRDADPYRAADLVLYGGAVLTLDAMNTKGSALAVRDGRILLVGTDRDALSLVGARTQAFDLTGRTAVPGFIETHNHPYFFGLTLSAPVDAGTPPNDQIKEIVERVADATADAEEDDWVTGYRYDDTLLSERRHPTRHDLDPASPHNPVVLVHVSGHFVAANSVALAHAGIGPQTLDPPGGRIHRDTSGAPTGVLAESAAFLLYALLPKQSHDEMIDVLGRAGDAYLESGVTTVHDTGVGLFGGPEELSVYRDAIGSGRFRTRVRGYLFHEIMRDLGDGVLSPLEAGVAGLGNDRFRLSGVKIIADGSLQGLTGCLTEGYACAPAEHGMMLLTGNELRRRVATLDDAGWQVAAHGNGDAAIQELLDAYARLGERETVRRHRIEHCQTVRDEQLDQMAERGILASFFVKHVYYWGDRHRDLFLGPHRARRISPLASARSRGVRYGLHADTPVTPVSPLEGMWCAVRRRTIGGEDLGPDQCVDTETALRAYTSNAAYLSFEEDRKGTLEPGKLADITVLSEDPTAVTPDRLRALSVEATVVGGDLTWRRDT